MFIQKKYTKHSKEKYWWWYLPILLILFYWNYFRKYQVKLLIHVSLSVMKPLGINMHSTQWNINRIYPFIPPFIPTGILYTSPSDQPGTFISHMPSYAPSSKSTYIQYTDSCIILLTNNQLWSIKSCQCIIIIIIPLFSHMQWLGIRRHIHVLYRNVSCLISLVQYTY